MQLLMDRHNVQLRDTVSMFWDLPRLPSISWPQTAFLGRLGPNRAKNTAPVNFLAPERGFLGVQQEPHFWAV